MSNITLAVVYAAQLAIHDFTPRQLGVIEYQIAVRHGIVFC